MSKKRKIFTIGSENDVNTLHNEILYYLKREDTSAVSKLLWQKLEADFIKELSELETQKIELRQRYGSYIIALTNQ